MEEFSRIEKISVQLQKRKMKDRRLFYESKSITIKVLDVFTLEEILEMIKDNLKRLNPENKDIFTLEEAKKFKADLNG